jgi:cytochrome c oxidase cbb3-type subunit 2
MNNGPFLFLGLFASMAVSWLTFVLGPQLQIGNLEPAQTVAPLPVVYPNNAPGEARQGAEVYRAHGCVYCHTEQVRPNALGSDIAHGWGRRRSVARDYIFEQTVMLGTQRIGPDLANAGARMDATAVLLRLYDPRIFEAHTVMPPYRYLFEVRKIGRAPSADALVAPPKFAAPDGYEIVPRPAAHALAAYIANLRQEPYLFEAPPPPSANSASTNAVATDTNAPAK